MHRYTLPVRIISERGYMTNLNTLPLPADPEQDPGQYARDLAAGLGAFTLFEAAPLIPSDDPDITRLDPIDLPKDASPFGYNSAKKIPRKTSGGPLENLPDLRILDKGENGLPGIRMGTSPKSTSADDATGTDTW